MELKEFKEKYKKAAPITDEKLVAKASVDYNTTNNVIICIEECSELQQTLTKLIRGKEDEAHVLEEMADVILAVKYLQERLEISDEELNRAINVKATRNYDRCH